MGPVELRILAVAEKMLSGQIGLVEGCRRIARLAGDVEDPKCKDLLVPFIAVDSETENLPIGELRSKWDPEALAQKDQELDRYQDQIRNVIHKSCMDLIIECGRDAG